MKRSNIVLAAAFAFTSCCFSLARADDEFAEQGTESKTAQRSVAQVNRFWGLTFAEISDVVRLHVPTLAKPDTGLLIAQIDPAMPGARLGLQVGDVILQTNGRNVSDSDDLPKPSDAIAIVVLRRGQVIPIVGMTNGQIPPEIAAELQIGGPPNLPPIVHPGMPPMGPGFAGTEFAMPGLAPGLSIFGRFAAPVAGGVSANSFSGGNESVSVSRNGDQISLDMSLPDLTDKPIRLRGSIDQIRKELQASGLSAAAKQRVMQAINQNR